MGYKLLAERIRPDLERLDKSSQAAQAIGAKAAPQPER